MGDTPGGADDIDPDAPWRPGFDGSFEVEAADSGPDDEDDPVVGRTGRWSRSAERSAGGLQTQRAALAEPHIGGSAPTGRPATGQDEVGKEAGGGGRRLRIAVALLVAAGSVAAGVLVLRPDDNGEVQVMAPRLPEVVEHLWTNDFDRVVDDVAIGGDIVVVGASGGLTAFELETGRQLWRRPDVIGGRDIPIDQIGVIDDVILVQMPGSGAGPEIGAFDRLTGTEIWRTDGDDGRYTLTDPNGSPLLLRRRRVAGGNVVDVIDPADGQPTGDALLLSSVTAVGRELGVQPATRRVAIWSPDRKETVAGPVDSFDLRAIASLDHRVVALDLDGRVAVYDERGVRTDEELVAAPAGSSPDVRADLVGVVPPVAVVASESSLGFTVDGGDIVLAWQRAGRVAAPVITDLGPLSLLVEPDGQGSRRETILDVITGITVVEPATGRERLPLLGRNGYLLAPKSDTAERALDAFGYDGRPLWSLPIGETAEFELLDDAVVIVDRRPGSSVLTVVH